MYGVFLAAPVPRFPVNRPHRPSSVRLNHKRPDGPVRQQRQRDGKLWVWEQFFVPPATDGESEAPSGGGQAFHLRQLDPDTGRELQVVDITAVMDEP